MSENEKLLKSLDELRGALSYEKEARENAFFAAGIAKSFEVSFEYAWKSLKRLVQAHGMEAYSPREVIKVAGRMDIIQDVELWLGFLEDRNLSVHDYLGIEDTEYLQTMHRYLAEATRLYKKHFS